ncbi:DISEASE RESISTANCE RPP13-LIKE PROTEIN 4 [Salix purpurea]|uniref:DISEASE RESISTANCE RPP13-LIKE PROTEIN 4 n=1 Tax=Salix purpurea TaxID=77065 RepID=A0A9Q0Q5B3_SALPP|nr:DISEASE RESISTANCE RPP13-LIKE PROTEIN 4 [Salix purpurea]
MAVVDAMIQILTQQVFTILKEQARFPLDFKDQFELMKTKLDLTKALLADTESLKEKKEVIKASLITLRGLIYEADNIMTDCLVRDEYEKEGSCTSLTFNKPLFWYQTGKKLKDVNSKLDAMERSLGNHLRYQEQSDHGGDNTSQVMKYTAQDYVPSEVIGLEEDLEKLKGWIRDTKDKLLRVGIFGMGGLGKTTIAQKLFNDQHVAAGYDKMIWVSVSQVSSDRRIVRSMLDQLESHCSVSDETPLLHKLNELLKGKICLIVMDDVWKINQVWWNQFFSGLDGAVGKGSCIIITTRKEDVLTSMGVGRSQFHKPKELTDNDSWLLFRKPAFSSYPDAQFEKVGKEILKKCGGASTGNQGNSSTIGFKIIFNSRLE